MATKLPTKQQKTHTTRKIHTENYLAKILARPSNCQDSGCDPTNVGPPSPNSTPLLLRDEVPLAKPKSHLPKIEE